MAGKQMHSGPTSETVRANIETFRLARGLTYAELSRELERRGHPIPPLGLRRIEAGERRVDVDDLTALALALRVTPDALLFPRIVGAGVMARVTGGEEIPSGGVWGWGKGVSGYLASDSVDIDSTRPLKLMDLGVRAEIREAWIDAKIARLASRGERWVAEQEDEDAAAAARWVTDKQIEMLKRLDPANDEEWAEKVDDPAPPSSKQPAWVLWEALGIVDDHA
ncbi:helix-turn-helix domain-containing protein [Terrabacter sp. BE26]|uniref:helix-turn-helix domain-containing protein n=1 Tax=Terrabacter sp. BE26 TaxID=2898152 RepID=UPI0035BE82D8